MTGIGPNTDAPEDLISPDCLFLIGEDPATSERLVQSFFGPASRTHSFRSYVFQKRDRLTTIFSGMGTACVEPMLWEMSRCAALRRLLVVGTAGLMPRSTLEGAIAYVIKLARPLGSGMCSAGLPGPFAPRWPNISDLPQATIVTTDFYYGFGEAILRPDHPLRDTALLSQFQSATEELVDMETAAFYGLSQRFMPAGVQFLAIKSPANPAGIGDEHLANTPSVMETCLELAADLLSRPT